MLTLVVENAIAQDEETSGATANHEVADFLKAEKPLPTQAEKMLDRLADKEATKPAAKEEEPKEPVKPQVDEAKLESLAETKPEPKQEKPKSNTKEAKKKLDAADDKLSGLLGD